MSNDGRNSNGNGQDDPFVTYLEGDKVRVLIFLSRSEKPDEHGFYLLRRRDGKVVRIQKKFVIKFEEKDTDGTKEKD